jgi:hypothetical protein
MSDKRPVYNKCINCSKYIETEIKDKSLFCSNECYEQFSCCNIFSKYYNTEETHAESLKCKIFFGINHKKKPYIKQTMLKLLISGNPLINIEMVSDHLSRILKLPVFISEKFRIENKFNLAEIKNCIKQKIEAENLKNYFIFICNSYDTDFISELLKDSELSFDKIITIDSEKPDDNDLNIKICSKCGNINTFFQADNEDESKCIICNSGNYKASEEYIISNKLKEYLECKNLLASIPTAYKYIKFSTTSETVHEIVEYLVYT